MHVDRDPEGRERDILLEFADFEARRVLEIGAADGRLTWRYADKIKQAAALDLSQELLVEGLQARPARLRSRLDFLSADARKLPFQAATFDLALFAWSL